ncbi:MAG TPA: hypothetical protein VE934_17925 [Polaromonas sp.]|uniref:hypothetical protein n=1 Tax=Polaromonas sp. TaxID=1869339 RepID=UPI002D2C9359|nr:hypothetical protein [Polaromonas sp.]HYW58834.1 hypothetical protein [Polaromonas sp.]
MTATVRADRLHPRQLQLELRQSGRELAVFLLVVLIIVGAVFLLVPQARQMPVVLLGAVGVAFGWCAYAMTCREHYTFDQQTNAVSVKRMSVLGGSSTALDLAGVCAVQQSWSGVDEDRRVVELVTTSGATKLRIPRRLTTLSAQEQDLVGRAIAGHLGVPLRSVPS